MQSEPHPDAAQILLEGDRFFSWVAVQTGQPAPEADGFVFESEEIWLHNACIVQLLFDHTEQQLNAVGIVPSAQFYRMFVRLVLIVAKGESELADDFHDPIDESR